MAKIVVFSTQWSDHKHYRDVAIFQKSLKLEATLFLRHILLRKGYCHENKTLIMAP